MVLESLAWVLSWTRYLIDTEAKAHRKKTNFDLILLPYATSAAGQTATGTLGPDGNGSGTRSRTHRRTSNYWRTTCSSSTKHACGIGRATNQDLSEDGRLSAEIGSFERRFRERHQRDLTAHCKCSRNAWSR